jgi:zinc transporter ZupT
MFSVIIIFLGVLITAIVIERIHLSEKSLRLLLAFSGAFILTLTFTHIIPEIFSTPQASIHDHSIVQNHDHNPLEFNFGYLVLVGFFLQILIERISGGAEHGHGHCDDSDHQHPIKVPPLALLAGISLHAFFEGMPFGNIFSSHSSLQNSLLIGIVLHNIPITIVLMGLFLNSGLSRVRSYFLILIFALMTPIGAIVTTLGFELSSVDVGTFYKAIMAIVVGIFLHISTTILFESNSNHRFNVYKFATILLGSVAAILTSLIQ